MAYSLDAACASSLYALKLAADELLEGRADAMLAGGVSRPDSLFTQMGFTQLKALSPTGVCRPFDRLGNGLMVGEGAGIFVLKRLEDARAAGDQIYGLIAGAGLSNDSSEGLMAPASPGQVDAMRKAYKMAGWQPWQVDYIECHATGTPLGDEVELNSLRQLWRDAPQGQKVVLGSVKSNIGHLLTAAGASGLARVLLAMKNETLPPTANFSSRRSEDDGDHDSFEVLTESQAWPKKPDQKMKAAISGFGFGGINAHLLIESYQNGKARVIDEVKQQSRVVIVSAAMTTATCPDLKATIAQLKFAEPLDGQEASWWGSRSSDWFKKASLEKVLPKALCLEDWAIDLQKAKTPPHQWKQMLQQQQLILKLAIDAAGAISDFEQVKDQTGVFIGVEIDPLTNLFSGRWHLASVLKEMFDDRQVMQSFIDHFYPALTADRTIGSLASIAASRVARLFKLGGPSYTISNDEQSGLQALYNGIRAIERGELKAAFVAAVDFSSQLPTIIAQIDKMKGKTSELVSIVEDGGVGFVVWQEEDALRRKLPILARVDELDFKQLEEKVPADSVKISRYLGAANGLKDFAANLLQLSETFQGKAGQTCYWLRNRKYDKRQISTSLSGQAQQNFSVTLSESECPKTPEIILPERQGVLFLRGTDRQELIDQLTRFRVFSKGRNKQQINETLRAFYDFHPLRKGRCSMALVFDGRRSNSEVLKDGLERLTSPHSESLMPGSEGCFLSDTASPFEAERTAFIYPATGHAYRNMGKQLSLCYPNLLEKRDGEQLFLKNQFASEIFWGDKACAPETVNAGAAISAQVAYGEFVSSIVKAIGINPGFSFGYSLGESASFVAQGAWKDRDGLLSHLYESTLFREDIGGEKRAVKKHWHLKDSDKIDWTTYTVRLSADRLRDHVEAWSRVYLLNINTDEECVIGGDRQQLKQLIEELSVEAIEVPGVAAIHCPVVKEVIEEYRRFHDFEVFPVQEVRFIGGREGRVLEQTSESFISSLEEQAVYGVNFPALVRYAYDRGVRNFIEIGPGKSLSRMVADILKECPVNVLTVSGNAEREWENFLRFAAQAFSLGFDIDPLLGQTRRQDKATIKNKLFGEVCEKQFTVIDQLKPAKDISPKNSSLKRQKPFVTPAQSYMKVNTDMTIDEKIWTEMLASQKSLMKAHMKHMELAQKTMTTMNDLLSRQMEMLSRGATFPAIERPSNTEPPHDSIDSSKPFMDYDQCLSFARGRIGDVLGEAFAEIDRYPTRVRLPDEPLMLCHRIMEIEAEPLSMTHGRLVTEHDVKEAAWYLDHGRIPTCIAVESGQADLFLAAYLGVDFKTKGKAVYRLLDACVTFHSELPSVGDVIRYDIKIHEFFYQSDMILFRFSFDATVDGKPLMSMRNGCAGFFSEEELNMGRGVVKPTIASKVTRGKVTGGYQPMNSHLPTQLNEHQLDALREGDYQSAFGVGFAGLKISHPSGLPQGLMRLVHRIDSIQVNGGQYGLGRIVGEADIHPDDWFLTCHFVDDMVMPGTLMYECCLHTLRVFLMSQGWVGEAEDMVCEPVPGVNSQLKCRGQVTATTKKVTYEIIVKEIGYQPEAYAIVDALMYADDKPVVDIQNMSLRYPRLNKEKVERTWSKRTSKVAPSRPMFTYEQILAFCEADPTDCFGRLYQRFVDDPQRRFARLPRPPYLFLSEVTACSSRIGEMVEGGELEAVYHIDPDNWSFAAEKQDIMPFSILLEVGLQACGFYAAYMGSALTHEQDLFFRNLDGDGKLLKKVTRQHKKMITTAKVTKIVNSSEMIIQQYHFKMFADGELCYEGETSFGFFSRKSLADQVGLQSKQDWLSQQPFDESKMLAYPDYERLPSKPLLMIDGIDQLDTEGGQYGLGFIRGIKKVDPEDWFFQAHFFQDPVMPGSLGLEAAIQLIKAFAYQSWGRLCQGFISLVEQLSHKWSYRGQVLQENKMMTTEVHIKSIDDDRKTIIADAVVSVDGLVIYGLHDFSLNLWKNK